MSCYHPLLAVDFGIPDPVSGKHQIKLLPRRVDTNLEKLRNKFGDSLLLLPCGKCIGCINDYKSTWAVRILLEASLYPKNSFITLTYSPECLPFDNKPHRSEIVKFFKRLRKEIGVPIRYFYCGEKGSKDNGDPDTSHRAHYHAIIFGYDFPDRKVLKMTRKGSIVYTSKILSKCWKFGLSSVGDVEPGSACYVAQYSMKKKLSGVDDGSFVGMSRMPGIGTESFDIRWCNSDTIYCALGKPSIPRFFETFIESIKPRFFQVWKEARLRRIRQRIGTQFIHGFRNEEEALAYEEEVKIDNYLRKFQSVYD